MRSRLSNQSLTTRALAPSLRSPARTNSAVSCKSRVESRLRIRTRETKYFYTHLSCSVSLRHLNFLSYLGSGVKRRMRFIDMQNRVFLFLTPTWHTSKTKKKMTVLKVYLDSTNQKATTGSKFLHKKNKRRTQKEQNVKMVKCLYKDLHVYESTLKNHSSVRRRMMILEVSGRFSPMRINDRFKIDFL